MEKLHILSSSAIYDICSSPLNHVPPQTKFNPESPHHPGIYKASTPYGKCSLLKILMNNHCKNDCRYCINRSGRPCLRTRFEPHEISKIFMKFWEEGIADGLFLSSGIEGEVEESMERILDTVTILRHEKNFKGYVHIKILPGADREQIKRAVTLANRVSINIEAPTHSHLSELSSQKDFRIDILRRMRWIKEEQERAKNMRNGNITQTTQFVVGASSESDRDILKMVEWLYREFNLSRSYFSAFTPIPKTPLESHPPTPVLRQTRLYQAEFLLRKYGFKVDELVFEENENLTLRYDPKTSIALTNSEYFPVDVNEAEYDELIRVPGIGPLTARRIMKFREKKKILYIHQLQKLGVRVKSSLPFLKLNGWRQSNLKLYLT